MRAQALPFGTARHALVAALAAAAVAVPVVLVVQDQLDRADAPVTATPAPAAPAAAKPRPARKPATARAALPGPGLPGSVAQALKAKPYVVVALYAAGDTVDMASGAEAEAGAALADVPYVPVNVNDESQIGDLAARLPSLAVPSVVVVGRGGRIVTQLEGWVDRQAVAGAVDAARGQ